MQSGLCKSSALKGFLLGPEAGGESCVQIMAGLVYRVQGAQRPPREFLVHVQEKFVQVLTSWGRMVEQLLQQQQQPLSSFEGWQ
mmetsp:Transcript_22212/g.55532  ORF Transcript_22212/g.55532 Transcript_22212/m.55532 type:complete len:84 (+) Transcript_22212:423-674(+)